jgi:hypothetical protein
VKEALGSLSRAGCDGRSGKKTRVGGRIGLSTITRYHLVDVIGTVRKTRAKEGMGTYPGPGVRGDRGIWPGWVGGKE